MKLQPIKQSKDQLKIFGRLTKSGNVDKRYKNSVLYLEYIVQQVCGVSDYQRGVTL